MSVRAFVVTLTLLFTGYVAAAPVLALAQTQAQRDATADIPSPAGAENQADEYGIAVVFAVATRAALQWLKKHPRFNLMSETATVWANRRVAIIAAFLASVGVHVTWDAMAGTLLISGLTGPGLLGGLWDFIRQWAMQEFVHNASSAKGN